MNTQLVLDLPNTNKLITKEWGSEEICYENEYLCKILFMKHGCRCSLQKHEFKVETVVVLSGQLLLTIQAPDAEEGNYTEFILGPRDSITIQPGQVHRMTGITDCYYVEASTPHGSDVIRLQDDYGRI